MPDFSFTIPANAVENGVPAAPEKITVDRGFSRKAQHRVLTANFGDGYEQRVRDGINTKNENFTVALNNRPAAEINKVAKFLDNYSGKNFILTVTEYGGVDETINVVCDAYNITYKYEDVLTLTTTFRRVYEP
jgi:phage-related protein